MRMPLVAIILGLALVVSGCTDKGLRTLRTNSNGPDEFMVLPVKPLTAPKNYRDLPPPTPGGSNLVDQHPNADAVVALGGRAEALVPNGVPASDGALVAASSRYGVPSNIRATLDESDAEFRRRQGRMTQIKLFPVDRYAQAYRREALDPFGASSWYRAHGANTPTSPPVRP